MAVWAVSCQKGGVGKTTTAVTLGGLLAERGQSVLLIDMDPQGSLTAYFGLDPQTAAPGLYELMTGAPEAGPPAEAIRPTAVERLALLPASTALATLERQFGARPGMGLILRRALPPLIERFTYLLLDCAPALGVLMVNALAACDHLLIPVQTEYLALHGLDRMLETVRKISRSLGRDIPLTVVPTLYDARTRASQECLARLQHAYAAYLWPGVIPVDTQFREAAQAGLPLSLFAPRTRGQTAYAQLLDTLTGHLAAAPQYPLGQAVRV